jgi:hypothetical protein
MSTIEEAERIPPGMARLTLANKIAAITWLVWNKCAE